METIFALVAICIFFVGFMLQRFFVITGFFIFFPAICWEIFVTRWLPFQIAQEEPNPSVVIELSVIMTSTSGSSGHGSPFLILHPSQLSVTHSLTIIKGSIYSHQPPLPITWRGGLAASPTTRMSTFPLCLETACLLIFSTSPVHWQKTSSNYLSRGVPKPMMPRYGMDTPGTRHEYGKDIDFTHEK